MSDITKEEINIIKTLLPNCWCGGKAELYITSSQTCSHGESSNSVVIECSSCHVKYTESSYAGYEERERIIRIGRRWRAMIKAFDSKKEA